MRSVAIVDDSPEVRALWRAELEIGGEFTVCAEGSDGREAVEIARTYHPDVMLLDLSMPGHGGLEALPTVVATSPQTRVVVLSAMGRSQFSSAALSLGAVAFLEKHLPAGSLAARLHETLGEDAAPANADAPAVAVVEPHRDDAALVRYLLGWRTCRVLPFATGAAALEALGSAPVALVLVAGALPDMTTVEFTHRLRRQDGTERWTPVVAMLEAPHVDSAVEYTVDDVLAKPTAAEPVQNLLTRYLPAEHPEEERLVDHEGLLELGSRISTKTLRQILAEFREATREHLRSIHAALDAGDLEALAALAHQVAGSAKSLAAPRLARAAQDVERAARSDRSEDLAELVQLLATVWDQTAAALPILPGQRAPSEPHTRRVPVLGRLRRPHGH